MKRAVVRTAAIVGGISMTLFLGLASGCVVDAGHRDGHWHDDDRGWDMDPGINHDRWDHHDDHDRGGERGRDEHH